MKYQCRPQGHLEGQGKRAVDTDLEGRGPRALVPNLDPPNMACMTRLMRGHQSHVDDVGQEVVPSHHLEVVRAHPGVGLGEDHGGNTGDPDTIGADPDHQMMRNKHRSLRVSLYGGHIFWMNCKLSPILHHPGILFNVFLIVNNGFWVCTFVSVTVEPWPTRQECKVIFL